MWGLPEIVVWWYGIPSGKGRSYLACVIMSGAIVENVIEWVVGETARTVARGCLGGIPGIIATPINDIMPLL